MKMKLTCTLVFAAVAAASAPTLAENAASGSARPKAAATQAKGEPMQRLEKGADRLREAIQALAQKPPGPQREAAIAAAHRALLETQQAMLTLPPELRNSGKVSSEEYGRSVKMLMASADSLRHAVQAMAQEPAGERRNEAIRQANRALLDTQVAMANAYQPGSAQTSSMGAGKSSTAAQPSGSRASGGKQQAQAATQGAAVLVLVPTQQAQGGTLANGCWVRFYDEKNLRGDSLTLAGPVDMPKMEVPGGVWRDWDSAEVGPKATVTAYDNENFRDRSAVLGRGRSFVDLHDDKLGWFDEIKSARVACG